MIARLFYTSRLLSILVALLATANCSVLAQCPAGESEWLLDFDNDNYGTSTAWDSCSATQPAIPVEAFTSLHLDGNSIYVSTSSATYNSAFLDLCPWNGTKTTAVGACGCGVLLEVSQEKDSDDDGDPDCSDPCPEDPSRNTSVIFYCGCGDSWPENDSDGDGVYDCLDPCPNDLDTNDSDNDLVLDCIDNCINTSNADQSDVNGNGVGDVCEVAGCTDILACNYDSTATTNNGTCNFPDAAKCEECIGAEVRIEGGRCNCSNSDVYDILEVCGGTCQEDLDQDGICDKRLGTDGSTLCAHTDSTGFCSGICWRDLAGAPCNVGDFNCENICDLCVSDSAEELDDCGQCIGDTLTYTVWLAADSSIATTESLAVTNTENLCAIGSDGCFNSSGVLDLGNFFYRWEQTDGTGCVPGTAGCSANESRRCNQGDDFCANLDGYCACGATDQLDECGVCGGPGITNLIYNCDGSCVNDADGDYVCDENEVSGCTTSTNCNYNSSAETHDASDCLTLDDCGNCGGTMAFEDASNAPCTITYADISGATCTQGATGCFAIIPAGCTESTSGACSCSGDMPVEGYDCDGNCIDDPGDVDTICEVDEILGCTDSTKCNYYSSANVDDSSCLDNDALGVCGGTCFADLDGDGLCDRLNDGTEIDDCVGDYDDCGICNGSSTYTRSGTTCTPGTFVVAAGSTCIPGNNSDCLPCAMSVTLVSGAPIAPDYRTAANERCHPDSSGCNDANTYTAPIVVAEACNCNGDEYDALGICGGSCASDADGNGVCDHAQAEEVPACFGTLVVDAVGNCGGNCVNDLDDDGLCDDLLANGTRVDPCLNDSVNIVDDCDICQGLYYFEVNSIPCSPGTYVRADGSLCDDMNEFGCVSCSANLYMQGDSLCEPTYVNQITDAPCAPGDLNCIANYDGCTLQSNSCDCQGSPQDAIGNCGGDCADDTDDDGICDTVDTCIGQLIDDCGQCGGTSFFTDVNGAPCTVGTPGCTNDSGECNCSGDTIDGLGLCGGTCDADVDADGVCDSRGGVIIDDCLQIIVSGTDSIPCDPQTNADCPTLDACGICGGDGPLTDCGCAPLLAGFCDCALQVLDSCLVCGGEGPLPFRYCNGDCVNPSADDPTVCQEDVAITITQGVLVDSDGDWTIGVLQTRDAVLELQELNRRMAERLEWGSLTGHSRLLTVQDQILSNGTLEVNGQTTLRQNANVAGQVVVNGSVTVKGDANILGTLFSNGGIESNLIQMGKGEMYVGGQTVADGGLTVTGVSTFHNNLDIFGNLSVSTPSSTYENSALQISKTTGNTSFGGPLFSTGGMAIDGTSIFQKGLLANSNSRFDHVTASGSLYSTGDVHFDGNLEVGVGMFTVDASSNVSIMGNLKIAKTLTVLGNLTLYGDADILGTTFARGGIRTKKLTLFGDMTVRGYGFLYGQLSAAGRARFTEGINLGSDLTIHSDDTASNDLWINSETSVPCSPQWKNPSDENCTPTYVLASDNLVSCSAGDFGCILDPNGNCFEVYDSDCYLSAKGTLSASNKVMTVSGATGLLTLAGDINARKLLASSSFTDIQLDNGFSVGGTLSAASTVGALNGLNIGSLSSQGTATIAELSVAQGIIAKKEVVLTGGLTAPNSNVTMTGDGSNTLTIRNIDSASNLHTFKSYSSTSTPLHVVSDGSYVASFNQEKVAGFGNGVKVQIDYTYPRRNNSFVRFTTQNESTILGQISGQTWHERKQDINYVAAAQSYMSFVDDAMTSYQAVHMTYRMSHFTWQTEMAAAAASALAFTGCFGFGIAACLPPISYIISHGVAVGIAYASKYTAIHAEAKATEILTGVKEVRNKWERENGISQDESKAPQGWNQDIFGVPYYEYVDVPSDQQSVTTMLGKFDFMNPGSSPPVSSDNYSTGVSYRSGSADYAEWLPKKDTAQRFIPGQVIGIRNGVVSLTTFEADNIFVVSTHPAVLGNMPKSGQESHFVKAAFLGQVPVLVDGAVNIGDFIVASDKNDGLALAIAEESIEPKHMNRIIGVSWDQSSNKTVINKVNVAMGLADGVGQVVQRLTKEFSNLDNELNSLTELAESIAQGRNPSVLELQAHDILPTPILPDEMTFDPRDHNYKMRPRKKTAPSNIVLDESEEDPTVSVFEYSNEVLEACFSQAMELLRAKGVDVDNHPFWGQYQTDKTFKDKHVELVRNEINEHNDRAIAALSDFKDVQFGVPITRGQLIQRKRIVPKKFNWFKKGFLPRDMQKLDQQLQSVERERDHSNPNSIVPKTKPVLPYNRVNGGDEDTRIAPKH